MDQDTCFKRLRKTFDKRDQEVEKLDQEVENLEQEFEKQQKQVQELQSKLLQQEDQHQEELSRRRILDCKICYKQPDCWYILLCGHMICETCAERLDQNACPFCRASFSGFIKCYLSICRIDVHVFSNMSSTHLVIQLEILFHQPRNDYSLRTL